MTAPTQQRLRLHRVLRGKLAEANREADQAIADYNAANAELMRRANGDPGRYHVLKRDDLDIAALGNRVTFRISNALRLAATVQCELLAELLAERQTQ